MSTNTSSIVNTLGAGSGIDIKSLAESLVEAERKPLKDRIDAKVTRSEARISGYGAMRSYLEQLKTSFEKLNEAADFGNVSLSNSQPAAFTAVLGAGAAAGSHDISVTQLASAQRSRSVALATTPPVISSSQSLTLKFAAGSSTEDIAVTASSAAGVSLSDIEAAIKNAVANAAAGSPLKTVGLAAQVVSYNDKGVRHSALELSGSSGEAHAFTLDIDPATWTPVPGGSATVPLLQKDFLQEAADAQYVFNGTPGTSASNSVSVANGQLTLNLGGVTTGAAKLTVSRDVQAVKDNIKGLITSYNDFQTALKELSNSKSEVETLGGSLAGDRLLQTVRNQMQRLVKGADTATGPVSALRDLGISIDAAGRMVMPSEKKLDKALADNFDDVVKMFSSSPGSVTGKGLSGDVIDAIDKMVSTKSYAKGTIQKQIDSVNKDVQKYKDDLTKLQARMEKTLNRYMNQFSVMESVVGESTSTRTGLKSSFEGLMAAYK